jgi:hypothetical protein
VIQQEPQPGPEEGQNASQRELELQ